jgi:hypothetical protein
MLCVAAAVLASCRRADCILQGVPMEDVLRVLRQRFGTSGIEEKAARPPKPQQ